MSWTTDKTILVAALTGYTEIVGNLKPNEASESKAHKAYTIILGDPELSQMMNNSEITVRRVILEINYKQKNIAEYDTNCESLESLKVIVAALSPFVSFIKITYPERWDEKTRQSTAKIEMYFGLRID